ncbi:MAG: AraC family transcriptional regulator [Polyangiaceae bacterium]
MNAPLRVSRWAHVPSVTPSRRPFTHGYASLSFVTSGSARMEQNGENVLREGDVMLVPAGMPHRMLEARRPECWGLAFQTPGLITDGSAELLAPFERVRDGGSPVVRVPPSRHAYLEGLFVELDRLGREPGLAPISFEAVQQSLLTLVLAEVHRAHVADPRPRVAGRGVVAEALRFIERRCLGPLTARDVAAAVGRTPTYITTALTKATGRSASAWILTGRMAEARRLLLHSDERVDIVAERVGYADATHFIRMFRRTHGVTPATFRASRGRAP